MMMDRPLLVSSVIDYAADIYPDVEVVDTVEGGIHRYGYRASRERIGRLANALIGLWAKAGDRVATLAWNGYRHFELYYAIAGIGAGVPHHQPAAVPRADHLHCQPRGGHGAVLRRDLPAAGREGGNRWSRWPTSFATMSL